MQTGGWSTAIAFTLYLAITFLFAWLAHRKTSKGAFMEDFFVGGRTLGPWVMALTWVATMASGGTFIGAPALGYTYGWSVMLWICGYMVTATVGMGVLGRRITEIGALTGALTFPDLLRDRFESRAIGIVSGIALILLYTAYMTAQYIAGARVIEAVTGLPYVWGALSFALTVGLYTAYGGFRAVAWTDSFQAVVMLLGILLTAGFAIVKAGGLEVITAELSRQDAALTVLPGPNNFLPLSAAFSFFLVWPLAGLGAPAQITRFLACRDTEAVRRASFLIGLYILLLYPAVIGIGIAGRVLNPDLAVSDHAVPATILAAVPPWLAGFVLAAPIAAIMSTISSFLLVTSGAIVRDLYQRNLRGPVSEKTAQRLSQISTGALAILPFLFALRPPPLLQYIVVFSGTGLTATFAMPLLLAVFWPRMNRAGCLAGMIVGFLTFLAQYAAWGTKSFFGFDPFLWSLLFSLIACLAGAMLAPAPSEEIRLRYFAETSGRLSGRA